MSFFPGLGGLLDDLGDAVGGVMEVDQSEIDALKSQLRSSAQQLEDDSFSDLALHDAAFGGSQTARELGRQHALAHTILAETITGVIQDLRGFHEGVATFERLIGEADAGAASDLGRTREAVDALVDASRHSAGDQLNLESRSQHLGGQDARGDH